MESGREKSFLPDVVHYGPAGKGVVIPPVRLHRYAGLVKMHYVLPAALYPAAAQHPPESAVCAEFALARFCKKERARLTPSHAAARAAAVLAFVRPGMRIVLSERADAPARAFFAALDARAGTVTRLGGAQSVAPDTGMVCGFGEPELAQAARQAGAVSVMDITWTPFFDEADVLLCDAQVYFGGDTAAPAGAVMASGEHARAVESAAGMLGAEVLWETAWKLRRGMELFQVRWARHCAGGAALAEFLRGQPQVSEVEYSGEGGRLALRLRAKADARELVQALREFAPGRGGGAEAQVFSPYLSGEGEEPELLYLFAGMSEPQTLIEDIERGLARL